MTESRISLYLLLEDKGDSVFVHRIVSSREVARKYQESDPSPSNWRWLKVMEGEIVEEVVL